LQNFWKWSIIWAFAFKLSKSANIVFNKDNKIVQVIKKRRILLYADSKFKTMFKFIGKENRKQLCRGCWNLGCAAVTNHPRRTRQKKNNLLRGEGEQDGDPSHLPPTPSGEFGARRCRFRENLWACCRFRANSQVVSFGETLADFPQTHSFLNNS
jgi:hypothetical protein